MRRDTQPHGGNLDECTIADPVRGKEVLRDEGARRFEGLRPG